MTLTELIKARVEIFKDKYCDTAELGVTADVADVESFLIASMQQVADAAYQRGREDGLREAEEAIGPDDTCGCYLVVRSLQPNKE